MVFALLDFDRHTSLRVSLDGGVVTFAAGPTNVDVAEPPVLVSMEADGIRDLVLALEAMSRAASERV
jgi:hypothetical protein